MSEASVSVDRMQELAIQVRVHAELALMVPIDEIEAMQHALSRQEAIMPIIDPTRYRDTMGEIEHGRRLLGIFLRYRKELDELAGMGIGRRLEHG